ncbi:heat shock factor protein-like isoform X4 [Bombus vosnesenskii]|uniref:Heat shock factor protein-like isoform X4 n=1 Tax=Bombus vosnesenskii TaxID=207650 RepID=A0A6J3K4C8_9HYME|nr:heat shock factor protein-like isoform X4 [Bombus vosnesenskii]XP_050475983.1 heat shock factor protein-like isoform X4 [Bombus huntii]
MHTIPELGTSVPAFLAKLWKLVEDSDTDDLICWSPNGRSFFIRNQAQFARELLPHYYKHNNMASFIRQLNMYGFHKKVSVEFGGLKCDKDEMEFAHQFFCKGHPYLVEHIKRKIASNKGQDPALTPIKPELMNKMLTEVRSMRGRQEHLDSRLGAMKRENEALWRELAMLRQKHLKQQQIVNKLIHFLVTLVQPSRSGGLSVKRRYPLMIDDSNRQRNKQAKLSKSQTSPAGPVIHELDSSEPDLDSEYIVAEMLEGHPNPAIESPEHNNTSIMEDNNMETIHLVDDPLHLPDDIELINSQETETKKKRGCKGKKKRKNKVPVKILIPSTEDGEEPREEMDNHLETMQTELDNLRDILRCEGYSIDANTLLGLFGADDPMSFGMPVNPELNPQSEKEEENHANVAENNNGTGGGELMAYNPVQNFLDFDDDIFLEATSPPTSTAGGDTAIINLYSSDSLDLEDSKFSFLNSLTNDVNTSS